MTDQNTAATSGENEEKDDVSASPKPELTDSPEATLDASDEKIAAKRAKKAGIPVADARFDRMLQKNQPVANELFGDFLKKLAGLGFTIVAMLDTKPEGIKPKIAFRNFTRTEHEAFLASMKPAEDSPTANTSETTGESVAQDKTAEPTPPPADDGIPANA